MKTYKAGYVADPALRQELTAIEQAAQRADPFVELQILHEPPERIRAGMVIYADGSDFKPDGNDTDPGSGEGLYRRNVANDAWVFIG